MSKFSRSKESHSRLQRKLLKDVRGALSEAHLKAHPKLIVEAALLTSRTKPDLAGPGDRCG